MIKHYNIRVTGRVQGVGFRYSALNVARDLSLAGFVRNSSDGSVYIEIEGADDQCDRFLAWCRKGPVFGRVDDVEISDTGVQNLKDFVIR